MCYLEEDGVLFLDGVGQGLGVHQLVVLLVGKFVLTTYNYCIVYQELLEILIFNKKLYAGLPYFVEKLFFTDEETNLLGEPTSKSWLMMTTVAYP